MIHNHSSSAVKLNYQKTKQNYLILQYGYYVWAAFFPYA